MKKELPWALGRPAFRKRKGPTLFFVVAGQPRDLWFPPQELSAACRNTSAVGNYIALVFPFVDYMGIHRDKEDPETVHEDTGHQAKPVCDPNLYDCLVIAGEDVYWSVYSFKENDPDDIGYQASELLGIYWVYEQAADDDGDAGQEEDNIPTPTDDELLYLDIHIVGVIVNFSAIPVAHVLLFEGDVQVYGYDAKDPWQHGACFSSHPTPVFRFHAESSCEDKQYKAEFWFLPMW